jgi:hypothetical protein
MPLVDPDPTMNIIWANDFTQSFTEGQAITMTTGDTGKLNPTSVAGQAYAEGGTSGNPWKAKERLSIPPGEPNTRYDAQTTMSASNSVVRIRNHVNADGTLRSSALKPIFGNGVDFQQKIKFTWRSWTDGVSGFSYVFDYIGDADDWNAMGGELGFPENGVAATQATIFYRFKNCPTDSPERTDVAIDPRQPHIYETTWNPGVSLVCKIDGVVRLNDTTSSRIWTTPKRWLLQSGGSSTTQGVSGSVYVDWITVST